MNSDNSGFDEKTFEEFFTSADSNNDGKISKEGFFRFYRSNIQKQ